jgi:uncharacterized membrane protein YfcA
MNDKRQITGAAASGFGAGSVNGLFGGGGGMLLIPGLKSLADVKEDALFSTSVSVMLPVSALTLYLSSSTTPLPWQESIPYLAGSALGGWLATAHLGFWGVCLANPLAWTLAALYCTVLVFCDLRTKKQL